MMSYAITCIEDNTGRFVLKNSGISSMALIFNLSNLRITILQAKNCFSRL